MNVNCKCGGKFRRCDIIPVVHNGRTLYQDTDSKVAHWMCNGCFKRREQKKRQPKLKSEAA